MTKAEQYFNELTGEVADVTPGKMFGALCMKTPNGKAAAMFSGDCIVVKLAGDAHAEAMSLKGARLFDPADGRPMKEWVQIPFTHKAKWKPFLMLSVASVKAIKAKPAKKK